MSVSEKDIFRNCLFVRFSICWLSLTALNLLRFFFLQIKDIYEKVKDCSVALLRNDYYVMSENQSGIYVEENSDSTILLCVMSDEPFEWNV